MRARWFLIAALIAALTVGVSACGDDDDDGGGGGGVVEGNTLTVYSSLPLQGSGRPQTTAMVNGAKLALEEKGNKVGKFTINYQSLDDSTAQAGKWDPGATSANARKAAQDPKTIAYMGEFNSGATAISLPILNEAGIPQVSPANTAVGLTTNEPGAEKGEPDKYYPTGKRTYARTPPRDTIQGAALATIMKEDGCTKVYILNDKEVYGAGVAKNVETSAGEQGMEVLGNEGIDPKASNYRSLASKIKSAGADCFFFGGVTQNNAVQVFKDVAAALPDAKLYGPDGVAEGAFASEEEGGIPASVAANTKVTVATLSAEEYEKQNIDAKKFFDQYAAKYGDKSPDPYAIYGYETMSLILDAIERAGDEGNNREKVLEAIFATENRKSVLGVYSIDDNGDTTLTDYGVYKIEGGELAFDKTVKAQQ
ncbi:MAG: branched-chain amino acid ABC transporter substrate-binding protein [Actinomycetota bacterium]|nr:branched-chain amino acid ABC transporter substrate-binding protein [Actinomycetota bacterium]